METMNVALPESMKSFVQERVSEGGYSSVSEYVRDLIRADQKRRMEERIDGLLLEGLNSGEPIEVTHEYLGDEEEAADREALEGERQMMPRFLILPAADRDLDEQAEYLAEHGSLEVALRFYFYCNRFFVTASLRSHTLERQEVMPALSEASRCRSWIIPRPRPSWPMPWSPPTPFGIGPIA